MENQKYGQVELKLEQLAHSKLSSLSQQTLLQLENRLAAAELSIVQLAAASDRSNRDFRQLLRASLEKTAEVEKRSAAASQHRQQQMEELRCCIHAFEQSELQEREKMEEKTAAKAEAEMQRVEMEVGELRDKRKRSSGTLNQQLGLQLPAAKQQLDDRAVRSDMRSAQKLSEVWEAAGRVRGQMRAGKEVRERGEADMAEKLRETVGAVKGAIGEERIRRERSRDKLMGLAEEAARSLLCK